MIVLALINCGLSPAVLTHWLVQVLEIASVPASASFSASVSASASISAASFIPSASAFSLSLPLRLRQ